MASDLETQTPDGRRDPSSRTPLLNYYSGNTQLDLSLRRLEAFLSLLGYCQSSSPLIVFVSCAVFLILGVAIPSVSIYLSTLSAGSCGIYVVTRFELCVLASQVSLAAISLVYISRNLRKYGIRKFLFVDRDHGQLERSRKEYIDRIQTFYSLLFWWSLPCFLVKATREIIIFVCRQHYSLWKSIVILLTSVASWTYLAVIFLSGCFLFNLICNLQVIHFEGYAKLPERDTDVFPYLEEHMRLRHYLSKISHRFRIYLLLTFVFVSGSEVTTLFQTTGYSGIVNFMSAGDFAVSSAVQVVGIIVCLHAATKISHRAQGIASAASRWHALITCSSSDSSHLRVTDSSGNLEAIPGSSLVMSYSESDLESVDNVTGGMNTQLASYMSYQKRQALVMYLQSNPGGITIFGWTVDRVLINTLFFVEMSLVLFVLGKTIIFTK